jgi:hypothetical protein
VLKIENEIEEIPQSVGVRQGDNMVPVLFLFLMTALAQTLGLEWTKLNIPILSVMITGDEHLADGKVCSHVMMPDCCLQGIQPCECKRRRAPMDW